MTEERLALSELLEKAGDGDFCELWRRLFCSC
jgi:hypothetical protein